MNTFITFQEEQRRRARQERKGRSVFRLTPDPGLEICKVFGGEATLSSLSPEQTAQPCPGSTLFAFCAWLMSRQEPMKMGAGEDCGPVALAIKQFMNHQGIEDPERGQEEFFVPMPLEGKE